MVKIIDQYPHRKSEFKDKSTSSQDFPEVQETLLVFWQEVTNLVEMCYQFTVVSEFKLAVDQQIDDSLRLDQPELYVGKLEKKRYENARDGFDFDAYHRVVKKLMRNTVVLQQILDTHQVAFDRRMFFVDVSNCYESITNFWYDFGNLLRHVMKAKQHEYTVSDQSRQALIELRKYRCVVGELHLLLLERHRATKSNSPGTYSRLP